MLVDSAKDRAARAGAELVRDGMIVGLGSGTTAALPAGTLAAFGGASAPAGWLLCDGSAVSRSVYSLLFTAIGTTYGAGDGSTTFNLPDLRGRVPVGLSTGGKTEVNTLAKNEGLAATLRNIRHVHNLHMNAGSSSGGTATPTGSGVGGSNDLIGETRSDDSDNQGMPAYLVVNYIIKT